VPGNIRHEITQKLANNCAVGILNAPDPSNNPAIDPYIAQPYTPTTHVEGRALNKAALQEKTGLNIDPKAPILFWPSRLDPVQKGCQLFADILFKVVDKYWKDGLQIAIVANGSYQNVFHRIVWQHDFHGRVAVCDFSEPLSRLGYAGSDFMLIPSLFEPCGLPQMVSSIYGSLPIARDTGGLHDTVTHLNVKKNAGNGFIFETYDSNGLFWAIDQAMEFYRLPESVKQDQITRIMDQSVAQFSHQVTAKHYFDIYESMLARPIVKDF
jgi:starch synthase